MGHSYFGLSSAKRLPSFPHTAKMTQNRGTEKVKVFSVASQLPFQIRGTMKSPYSVILLMLPVGIAAPAEKRIMIMV